jgi:hypothetical protein
MHFIICGMEIHCTMINGSTGITKFFLIGRQLLISSISKLVKDLGTSSLLMISIVILSFSPPKSLHSPFYPQIGPYSSIDPQAIRIHLEQLAQIGVDTIVASWWGRVSRLCDIRCHGTLLYL